MPSYKQLLCPFHQQNTCNYGDGCIYSHKPEEAVPIPADACIFFLRSNCMYGAECRRRHLTIEQIVDEGASINVVDGNGSNKNSENATDDGTTSGAETTADKASTSSNEIRSPTKQLNPEAKSYATTTVPSVANESDKTTTLNPEAKSYAAVVPSIANAIAALNPEAKSYASAASVADATEINKASVPLCSYFESHGFCVYPHCTNIHGNLCDFCGFYAVHPYNQQLSDQHRIDCVKIHEESMEISFAFQKSKDLTCAICLDVVLDKEPRKNRRFGILENCVHIYCIECIRRWRNSDETDKKNKRNCPQCRVKSDYIIPSEYFYDDKEQKGKLIENYKKALGNKHCRHFKKGKGKCPFLGACFYKHEYPDGTKAVLPKPSNSKVTRINLTQFLLPDSLLDWEDNFSATDMDDIFSEDFEDDHSHHLYDYFDDDSSDLELNF